MLIPLFVFSIALVLITVGFGLNFLYLGYFRPTEMAGLEWLAKGSGYFMLAFGIMISLSQSFWIEKTPVPRDEYTIEHTQSETIFRHEDMKVSTDKKYWAEIANQPDEYCVYESVGYNLYGMWKGDGMLGLSTDVPCEEKGKFEF